MPYPDLPLFGLYRNQRWSTKYHWQYGDSPTDPPASDITEKPFWNEMGHSIPGQISDLCSCADQKNRSCELKEQIR